MFGNPKLEIKWVTQYCTYKSTTNFAFAHETRAPSFAIEERRVGKMQMWKRNSRIFSDEKWEGKKLLQQPSSRFPCGLSRVLTTAKHVQHLMSNWVCHSWAEEKKMKWSNYKKARNYENKYPLQGKSYLLTLRASFRSATSMSNSSSVPILDQLQLSRTKIKWNTAFLTDVTNHRLPNW